ncbi:MAG: HAD family hydrolase [Candidatus Verstraetearchaeota archaeon]|nr:HAD family hydrolase [Candidatus Verstraetearchaeota archaeon]
MRREIRFVSFDVDGTLVTPSFADIVWLEALPQAVSDEWGIPLEDAKKMLYNDYNVIGPNRPEWYDLEYWVKRYRLRIDPKSFVNQYKDAVTLYPEVIDVLERLKDSYELVVISNSSRLFLEITTRPLRRYFKHIFSTLSDLRMMKDYQAYLEICRIIPASPSEVVHVGDSMELDYVQAKKAGILAFYLDREGKKKGRRFIKDLRDLLPRLLHCRM